MNFNPSFNIDDEKFNICDVENYNIKFDIEGGDLLSLSCSSYTGKYIKFELGYCDNTKRIIPYGIINNNLNKVINVYFEFYSGECEEPMYKIYLKDFKFIGYFNLMGFFNDIELDEINDGDVSISKKLNIDYKHFNFNKDDDDEVKVFYTFSGFFFENCDVNRTRMDKINTITEPSVMFNNYVGKENVFLFDENFEIKKVE